MGLGRNKDVWGVVLLPLGVDVGWILEPLWPQIDVFWNLFEVKIDQKSDLFRHRLETKFRMTFLEALGMIQEFILEFLHHQNVSKTETDEICKTLVFLRKNNRFSCFWNIFEGFGNDSGVHSAVFASPKRVENRNR